MVCFAVKLILCHFIGTWSLSIPVSCSSSTNTPEGLDSHLLYGGVLTQKAQELGNNSDEATAVVRVTQQLARQGGLLRYVPRSGTLTPVSSNVTKTKLVLTRNGLTPASYVYEGRGKDGRVHRFRRQIFLGVLYTFTLTWPVPAVASGGEAGARPALAPLLRHHFTVSRDLRKKYYVYEHRVLCSAATPALLGDESCSAGENCEGERPSSMMAEAARLANSNSVSQADVLPWQQCQQHGRISSGFDSADDLTVLSYNIWNFNSADDSDDEDYARRVKRIGRLCRQSAAAIIAFQEVRFAYNRGGPLGPSQVDHLSTELKDFQFVFQAAMTYPEGIHGRVEEGPAIFSAFPIVSSDYILLPRDVGDERDAHQRILLHAEIDTPQVGMVHVFVTHLSLSEAARNRSAVAIWRYMKQFDGLLVLAGDLNAEPHSPAMQYLAGLADIDGSTTELLKDAWTVFHEEPRPAAPDVYDELEGHDHGLTFSTLEDDLVKRIDYLFYRAPSSIEHTSTLLVDDGGRWVDATSDHLGVKATFRTQP